MGTNYYFKIQDTDLCNYCGRGEEGETLHIGKGSVGWEFSFYSPSDTDIESWLDWLEFMKTNEGKILDEYNVEISLDDFIDYVEKSRGKRNHYAYMKKEFPYSLHDDWCDSAGWSFTRSEFS